MAGRRGATVQLMVEVNTEEDWEALLTKKGLIVVDVYSEWCGPCSGMVSNLRKIKLDIGGDFLILAQAKSDNIEALKRFRNKSEPTWMFIAGGQMVNLMFGANAPRLTKLIISELEKEKEVLAGTRTRETIPFDELSPEEKERFEKQEAKRQALQAKKDAELAAIAAEKLQKKVDNILQYIQDYTVILFMPYAFNEEGESKVADEVKESLKDDGYIVQIEKKLDVDPKLLKQLLYEGKQELSESLKEALSQGQCVAWLMNQVKVSPAPATPLDIPLFPPTEVEEPVVEEEWTDAKDRVVELIYKEVFYVEMERSSERIEVKDEETEENPATSNEVKPESEEVAVVTGEKKQKESGGEEEKVMKEVSFVEKFSKSDDCPAVWTPQTERLKAIAILELFPEFSQEYALPEPEPIPPHMTLVFGIDKKNDVVKTATEFESEILKMGFFSSSDPDKATYLAKSAKKFDKIPRKTGNEAIVVVVSHVRSDPLLAFCEYSPTYISRSVEEGEKLSIKFFPPRDDDEDDDSDDEEVKEEEAELEGKVSEELSSEAPLDTNVLLDEVPKEENDLQKVAEQNMSEQNMSEQNVSEQNKSVE